MQEVIGSYEQIPIDRIYPSKTNPRKFYDQEAMADLTASIAAAGIQQPLTLRPSSGDFEIVCGERRYKGAKAAGLKFVPAIVRKMTDDEAYQAQIIENLQREDLGPMEEAEGYAAVMKGGATIIELAAKVGKPGAYVSQRLQLLKLIAKGKKALSEGKLLLGHALEVAKLKDKEQEKALDYCMPPWGTPPSLPALKEWIRNNFRLELSKAPFSIKDAHLHETAGACVDCPKRTGADKLLFNDVKEGDSCLDPKCYETKVKTVIHVRVEELKKTQDSAPLLTHYYVPQKGQPAGTLGTRDYELVDKRRSCESAIVGVMQDGMQIGQKVRVCLDKKCEVHRSGGNRYGGPGTAADQEKRRKEAAKERRDGEIRIRTARAVVDHVLSSKLLDEDVDIEDAIDVADYAFERMDHAQDGRLAKVLGWDKKVMGCRVKDRREMLAGMGIRKALSFAVLASIAGDLTVQHSYGPSRPDRLTKLAERHDVNVASIAAIVDAEIKAKAKPATKKAAPVKKAQRAPVKKLSAEARKRINEAMKKRWAERRKKAGAKS